MKKHIKLALITIILLIMAVSSVPKIRKGIKYAFCNAEHLYLSNKILANCSGYNYIENSFARIYYTDEDSEYINLVKAAVDLFYPLLETDFNFSAPKAVIVIYPKKDEMLKSINSSSGDAPMGAYYGGVINILSPRLMTDGTNELASKSFFLDEGPIIHEMSHFMLDSKTNGNYEMWFSEGLALYYEYKYTAFEWRSDLKEKSQEITLTQLRRNFKDIDESSAYRRAFDIVNGIALTDGEVKLRAIIDILSQGGAIIYT